MSGHVWLKRVMLVALVLLVLGGFKAFDLYRRAFKANIFGTDEPETYLYIATGWDYDDVIHEIKERGFARNLSSLEWVAQKKNYANHVNPGRYLVKKRMSNNDFINMLRSGTQQPVKLSFNNMRTLRQFTAIVGKQLEMNGDSLFAYLKNNNVQQKYGFNEHTIKCMFIPNTYEIYWNISPELFSERMKREYDNFWNSRRERQAEELGMSKTEVITLASIVNEETKKNDEKARIAGLYINRLNRPMRLQADPTVIYAWGDFNIRRVLRKHYQIKSPYNTYRVDGLPPGPICFPEISSIDAVLRYEKHDYLYMCAKADFSGYHSFAKTLSEHNKNAALYQRELNKRRIYR